MTDKKDTQSQKYQLTINNPEDKGITHEKIFEILRDNFKTLQYLCMADEMGQTFHTHVFVCFHSRVRFSMIKKHFPLAHIEPVKGTVSQNIAYIKKSGKWADTDKRETTIEGSFEEFGNRPPDSKGRREDMTELYRMISEGMSNAEILAVNQDYILNLNVINLVRTTLLIERFKHTFRLDLKVIYIYGETGSGKTRGVLEKHGCENVYRVTDYDHPFDNYNCQPVICFDEFRNSLRLKEMLSYCDIYPIELPARYSNKFACFDTVYIVSNWELERQYGELQKTDKESWKAFLRRIHQVHVYNKDGEVTIYDSIEKYMKRNETFHEITESEQITLPFNK